MPDLKDSIAHKVRRALDHLAGQPSKIVASRNIKAEKCFLAYSSDIEYDSARDEWIMAIIQFQRIHKRVPDNRDILDIAHALGYRRVIDAEPASQEQPV